MIEYFWFVFCVVIIISIIADIIVAEKTRKDVQKFLENCHILNKKLQIVYSKMDKFTSPFIPETKLQYHNRDVITLKASRLYDRRAFDALKGSEDILDEYVLKDIQELLSEEIKNYIDIHCQYNVADMQYEVWGELQVVEKER